MSVIGTFKSENGTVYMATDGICSDAFNIRTIDSNPKVILKTIGLPFEKGSPMLIGCVGNYRILNVIEALTLPYCETKTPYHYISRVFVRNLVKALNDESWSQQENDKDWGLTIIWNQCVFEVSHTNFEVLEPALPYTSSGAAMETLMGALAVQYKMGVHPSSALLEGLYVCDLHHVYAAPPFYLYTVRPDVKEVDCMIYGTENIGMKAEDLKKFWD